MCPRSHLTSSSPSGNSSRPCCRRGGRATRSGATAPASPTGRSSRSWSRSSCSAAPTKGSPTGRARPHHAQGPARRVDRAGGDGRLAGDGARSLRPDRLGLELPDVGRWTVLHHEGPLRRGEGGQQEPGGPRRQAGHQTLDGGAVDARGIPLGTVTAPADRHDSPLLAARPSMLRRRRRWGDCPRVPASTWIAPTTPGPPASGCESAGSERRDLLEGRAHPPLGATKRWVAERTGARHNAHKKLVWCTQRRGRVVDFWVAFSDVVIIVRRLIREGWTRYRWEGRPSRKP